MDVKFQAVFIAFDCYSAKVKFAKVNTEIKFCLGA